MIPTPAPEEDTVNPTPSARTPSHEVWQRPFVRAHRKWCDDFVVESRLRHLPGPAIGDRLGEVESHCTATGETPAEAFGDPVAYAAGIARESAPEPASGIWTITVLSTAQVVALLVGTTAVSRWAGGEELSYNLVQAGLLGLFVLVLLCLPALLPALVRRPWAAGLPLAGGVPLLALGAALSTRFGLPAVLLLPAAPTAVGLFAVVLVLAWWEHRVLVRDLGTDLVTSPLSPVSGTPGTARRRRRWTALLPAGMLPLAYLVLSAVGWLLA